MKKITWILLGIASIYTSNLQAQSTGSAKLDRVIKDYRLGVYVGLGTSSLKPKSNETDHYAVKKTGGKLATSVGIIGEKNFDDRYGAYIGIGMDWSGGSMQSVLKAAAPITTTDSITYAKDAEVLYKLQHLTIPLGLKLKAANIENIRIFTQVGVDLNVVLSKKGNYTITQNKAGALATSKDNIKLEGVKVAPANIGWHFGVGAEYALKSKNAVSATILYHNSFLPNLTDPSKFTDATKGQYKFEDGKTTANTIAIRIGYFF